MSKIMSAYAGDQMVSRDQLRLIDTPEARGRFHQPVPFADYVDLVEDNLDRYGLKVINEEHLVGHESSRHFGVLEVAPKAIDGELITADEWSLFVALRGSHDQSVQRGLALGRSVFVCSNLCFSGSIATINTKQTTNVWQRLPSMVRQGIAQVPEMLEVETKRVSALQGYEFRSARHGDAALVEIHRRGGMTAAQLGRAVEQWDAPRFEEHARFGLSAWRLEQAVTEAVKPAGSGTSNMFQLSDRGAIASQFLSEVVDFRVAA